MDSAHILPDRLRPRFSQRSFAPLRKASAPLRMTAFFDALRTIAFPQPPASFRAVLHLLTSRLTSLRELSGRASLRPARGAFHA